MELLQQWVWFSSFILVCLVPLILLYRRAQPNLLEYTTQDLNICSTSFGELFRTELASYLIRTWISFGFGMLGTLCNKTDGFMATSILIGILIGTAIERVF